MRTITALISLFAPKAEKIVELLPEEKNNLLSKVVARYYRYKLRKRYGILVGHHVKIGENLIFPHPNGIIIGSNVKIGDNVRIYQQVTLGGHNIGDSQNGRMPEIGNNVVIFAGAKVLGNIRVADGTIIGANAVVLHDTVENGVYAGVPAVFKKWRESDGNKVEG